MAVVVVDIDSADEGELAALEEDATSTAASRRFAAFGLGTAQKHTLVPKRVQTVLAQM